MTDPNRTPPHAHDDEAQPGPEAAPPDEAEITFEDALRLRIKELEAEKAELDDARLRLLAELENTRKRAQREVEEAGRYAVTRFARDLLEVADNLGLALDNVPEEAVAGNEQLKALVEGVALTRRTLESVFERQQIKPIAPEPGERFDHNRHQAMLEIETGDHPPGSVAMVMQNGWVLADRLLRPAMVGVAKAPPAPVQGAQGADERPGGRLDTTA